MRLKKLTICGFKSFADKVSLDFDCDIVGIVGPNGCGKSNIVDAFRWVLGEQSAKSLRGDKMHDVLFAGTDKRKPLNYAEVSLTFTDIADALPIPYEELNITRRLYRSGESEYFINKESARLKDIQSLFLGSGIGKNAFSIFEQGKLDQIIHLSPLDRRAIFDEAAGTSRFLLRKKETVRKLSEVTENFLRVKDIHTEIGTQAKLLKKQATHAKSYQENAQRLELLEKQTLMIRWNQMIQKLNLLQTELSAQNSLHHNKLAESTALEELQNKERQLWAADELVFKEKTKELHLFETKVKVHEAELNQKKQRILEIKKREENVKKELELLEVEKRQKNAEIKEHQEKLQSLNCPAQLSETLQALRADTIKKMQQEGEITIQLQKKTLQLEAKKARIQVLEEQESRQKTQQEALQHNIFELQKKVEELTKLVESSKLELGLLEKEHLHLKKIQIELQKDAETLLKVKTEKEGHLKALTRLKEEMEGFSSSSKALLKEAQDKKSPLFGKLKPLLDALSPDPGYENLTAAALKTYADTLVVDTDADLALLLTFAQAKGFSDFSVVINERVPPSKKPHKATLAAYLQANPLAYHFTKEVKIEDNYFCDPFGVFFYVGNERKTATSFHRRRELETLTSELKELQVQSTQSSAALNETQEKLKVLDKKRSELFEHFRKKEMDLIKENFGLQQTLRDLALLEKNNETLSQEKITLTVQKSELQEIENLKKELLELKERAFAQAQFLKSQEILLEKAREMQQKLEILHAKEQLLKTQENKLKEEELELIKRTESTFSAIVRQENEFSQDTNSLKQLALETKEMEKRLLELRKGYELREKEMLLKRKQLAALEKEIHGLEIQAAQIHSEKNSLEEELKLRHHLSSELLSTLPLPLDLNLEEAHQEMTLLRKTLDSAGAVNMTAIAEYQEKQERFEYLDTQLKDLEGTKADLEEIIAKLDQECRKIFRKTFQQIKENFQRNFAILFNGGTADLSFTESSDILEAGVEIVAKPPGKQMRSISLLSGGEKCLTALALLFSIFEVKPAPFCILDEVDAPLDDSNIDRFTQVLGKFIEKTQFLIVTHKKKTMAIADLLVGVSMEEKGVSKLISLVFEKSESKLSGAVK